MDPPAKPGICYPGSHADRRVCSEPFRAVSLVLTFDGPLRFLVSLVTLVSLSDSMLGAGGGEDPAVRQHSGDRPPPASGTRRESLARLTRLTRCPGSGCPRSSSAMGTNFPIPASRGSSWTRIRASASESATTGEAPAHMRGSWATRRHGWHGRQSSSTRPAAPLFTQVFI
jgi:hypothetical protein